MHLPGSRLASSLLYNDATFLPETVLATYDDKIVHGGVVAEWAKAIGVRSLRSLLLSDTSTMQVRSRTAMVVLVRVLFCIRM